MGKDSRLIGTEKSVSISVKGRKFEGSYRVESGQVMLWVTDGDGVTIGPMTMRLGGFPDDAAAKRLLEEYAASRA